MAWLDDARRRWTTLGSTLLVFASVTGCGQSPTAPTPVAAAPATPPAFAGAVTLTGQVTEGPPTTLTEIAGAVVSVVDGVNAGKSTRTDNSGLYTFEGLNAGPATISVTADGYTSASQALQLTGGTTADFQLMPVPRVETHTLTGDIAATDGTCSDGIAEYPCRIVAIPIHNSGQANATLTWTGSAAKLAITLFQTGVAAPIARSASAGANQEDIGAVLPGGADYEFRITFASGSGSTTYTLQVTHMN